MYTITPLSPSHCFTVTISSVEEQIIVYILIAKNEMLGNDHQSAIKNGTYRMFFSLSLSKGLCISDKVQSSVYKSIMGTIDLHLDAERLGAVSC